MKSLFSFASGVLAFSGLLLFAMSALANIPGGGNGAGANVTLVNNGDGTVTMANGVVTAQIGIAGAQILQLTYNGVQVLDTANGGFYWQGTTGYEDILTTIVDPSTNGGNFAIIQLYDSYTNSANGADAYRYFALFRGSPGVYTSEVMVHTAAMPAGGTDISSLTGKLNADIFNWLAQDTGRNQLMERVADFGTAQNGVNNAPKEVFLLTAGQLAGRFECKYDSSGDLGALGFSGWCSTNLTTNFGIWVVHPSDEYFSCGPMHKEILAQMMLVNATFKGVHYGFHDDLNLASGENWSKVAGPLFLYFNKVASGTANPQTALYSDAVAQTAAERGAWPYNWFTDTNFVKAAGRSVVTGKMVIADGGNPNASAANLWVGLAQQPSTPTSPAPTDFQLWGKKYQYWTKTDSNGNFVLTNVVAGNNYTLFAFGPGSPDQFQSQPLSGDITPVTIDLPPTNFSVTVSAGTSTNLGTVTWTPTRVGATVWEMGVPDRDTTEFRHGVDYWHGDMGNATNFAVNWAPWQNFSLDFPNGLTYTVGQSHWDKDWDYAQGTILDPVTGNLNGNTWTISFNLPNAPTNSAQASMYFGIASSYQGPVIVTVNGTSLTGSSGFFPFYSDSGTANDAMIRMGSHGIFCDERINFAGSLLHQGQNTITLNMRKGGYFANSTLYDYVRLELAGYIPPAPTSLSANAGNGLVSLFWPSAPGATGYKVLRSTTSGSGYATIATNVVGPVCGSVDDTAAFTDTNAVNGTTYYYLVQSANPNGSSTNSVQASAAPAVATPAAPSAPVSVTATATNNTVTLKWNASSGAARYLIQRTALTIGAETTYTPGGINPYAVINSYVTSTNYTDTALANNVTYSYLVSAANANGQSVASTAVTAMPSPAIPAVPSGLSATVVSNQVTFFWATVSGASSYSVQRATAIGGPYTIVDNPEPQTSFIDAGLNYNTTYYYEVASASLGGISAYSSPIAATTTPPPPSPVTAIPGNTQVFIDWGDSVGATNYVLRRATVSGGPYTTIISTTNTYYLDTAVNNGTTYYYVVYAIGLNGTGPLSAQTTATPTANPQMIKSDTTTMNTSSDWSGVAPVINAVGLFNNIISAANAAALTLGADVTVGGLVFTNNMNGPVSVATGNTLTLGSAGIDMSKANQSVTFNNAITLAAPQVWNVTNSRTFTMNGAFTSASNTVIKTGGGTLSLDSTASDSGANIQVNSGTVQANASSGIMISLNGAVFNVNVADSNPINVLAGGGTEQNVGGNRTWSGALSGSGPLTVISASTHTWSGNNSAYAGTLTVQGGGTLRLSSVNAVSAGTAYNFNSGNMSANATGIFNLGSLAGSAGSIFGAVGQNYSIGALNANTDFGGVISGATMIIKTGIGTQTLSGANTYTGSTVVSNGVLQIGNGGTSGVPGAGNVTDNATLAFNRSDAIDDTGFGVISGTGNLAKRGTGRLALTKAHTYTGATTVEAGTLALTNSGSIASSSGIVILSGALFDVSGTTGGTMTLASGKTLSGSGLVKGGFTIGSGAILAPGNSIGALTFSNALTLASGCTNIFEISKSPTTNDVARVFGALTNGGVLIVTNISGNDFMAGDSFKLFNAAGYNGSFAKVILPSLTSGLTWNTNTLNTNGTITVTVTSQPVIGSIVFSGNDLICSGAGGVANANYYLLGTTNLITPITNWARLQTNQFDSLGNFIFTNTPASDWPQGYYQLLVP